MAQRPFGRILMEARERQGLEIDMVSRQLRIRADILRAIEHNDFAHMPARGYARNMVNSYARLLGLNSAAITNQYLKEANEYQVSLRDAGIPTNASQSRLRGGREARQRDNSRYGTDARNRRSRDSRDDMPERQRNVRRNPERQRSDRQRPQRHEQEHARTRDGATISRSGRVVYDARKSTRSYNRPVPYDDSFVQRSEMRNEGFRSSLGKQGLFSGGGLGKLPLVIGLIVIVIILFIVITQVVGCVNGKNTTTNTSVPITGVSDTTNSGQNQNTENTVTETPPTSCIVQYTVPSGTDVWLEVYENDSATPTQAEIVSGPSTAVFTVTGTWRIVSPSPTAVSVTVDGSPVELTANDSGMYEASVDFAVILNQWAQTHKSSVSSNTASKNTNANTTTTNSASNKSTTTSA